MCEKRLAEIERERQGVYKAQENIRANMAAMTATGKEGELRASCVDKLRASEERLEVLAQEEIDFKAAIERLKQDIDAKVKELG